MSEAERRVLRKKILSVLSERFGELDKIRH